VFEVQSDWRVNHFLWVAIAPKMLKLNTTFFLTSVPYDYELGTISGKESQNYKLYDYSLRNNNF
jgi:hypothetical protein